MIRCLTIEGVYLDDTPSFAFFDTINDTILSFDGTQIFDSVEEFLESYEYSRSEFELDRLEPKYQINLKSNICTNHC